jgi:hypothetical protein
MLPGFVIGDRGLAAAGDSHPLWMTAHATLGDYLIVGASAVGQFHLKRELPRDDAFVIRSSGPWMAIALSDGVGSRPLSRFGASYVAEALPALLLRPLSGFDQHRQVPSGTGAHEPSGAEWLPPPALEDIELDHTMPRVRPWRGIPPFVGLRDRPFASSGHHDGDSVDDSIAKAASTGWWSSPFAGDLLHLGTCPSRCGAPAGNAEMYRNVGDPPEPSEQADLLDIMRQSFVKTHLGLREHACGIGLELADLSCTALALLLNIETGRGVAGQIGDGALLGLTAAGHMGELVEVAESGDLQAVHTISRPSFQDHLAIQLIEPSACDPYVAYYAMTDGVADDLLYAPNAEDLDRWGEAVDANLRTATSAAQAGAAVLNWLATYQVKGSWDDRTLVVVTRRSGDDERR